MYLLEHPGVVLRIEERAFGEKLEEARRDVGHDEDPLVVLRVPELRLQPLELKTGTLN